MSVGIFIIFLSVSVNGFINAKMQSSLASFEITKAIFK